MRSAPRSTTPRLSTRWSPATAALAFALPLLGSACGSPPTADEVQAEISAANYCGDSTECVDLGSRCPFGCYVLVNQAEQSAILDLIEEYQSGSEGQQCTYSCVAVDGVECTGGRCVVRPIP